MKRKGFTLIELLAVIVVLAIIALIATPIVMNTIKNAKKGAAERSADNYIKQVETTIAEKKLENNPLADGPYTIDSNGNLTGNGLTESVTIEMNGNKPTSGTVTISNGGVSKVETTMTVGDYDVRYNQEKNKYEATEKENTYVTYKNGQEVYFNVTTGEKCSSSDYTETQSNYDVTKGCMKFYAFNDDGGETINLILDHGMSVLIEWVSGENNPNTSTVNGPREILDRLKSYTSSWKGTETPTNYTMDQTGQPSNAKYTIDYSGYKARLITAQEIAQITGNTSWDEKTATTTDKYYFDSKTSTQSDTCKSGNTTGCSYGWLYDRASYDCTTYGCLNNSNNPMEEYGYWTASSVSNSSRLVWFVESTGVVGNEACTDTIGTLRPVIEVLKSKLS